ncbi:MAG: DUF1800 family protein [Acidimicrobiales bacterium]
MADDIRSRMAHLWRRAGFGARPDELDAAVAAGWDASVDRLVAMDRSDPGADAVAVPALPGGAADAEAIRTQSAALVTWWLDRMVATANPLREKLTLFWHGHFATSVQKVRQPALMYRQNQLLRTAGAGNFADLAVAVAKDPAMLIWLDANQNRKASPNENLAREMLELFTMGIGHYGEDDVKAAARALTGWQVDRRTGALAMAPAQHDPGPETFLGHTGAFTGEDVVRLAASGPDAARFVAAKVFGHFARPVAVEDGVVADLAAGFARDLDVARLLRAVFGHPEFTAPATRTGLVKQPVEYVAGILRAFGLRAADVPAAVATLSGLGQVPFAPPNVGGWPQNGYWLNTSTALDRLRFAAAVAARAAGPALASVCPAGRAAATARILSVDGWGPATAAALAGAAADPRTLLTIALVSPEYVLA